MVGPDLCRRPLAMPIVATAEWLREWALTFLDEGQRLTTPIEVDEVDGGVLLRFAPSRPGMGYKPLDEPETADEKWAAAKAAAKARRPIGKSDGALLIVAEEGPGATARVRVARAEMGKDVGVKEMSEAAVLARLENGLAELERKRR
eukprot:2885058-Prymnesium_polylepis.1